MSEAGEPQRQRPVVGLSGAVLMSAAAMGPAVSTFFNPQFSMPFSGAATPFVYVLCLAATLIAASGTYELARELPSAGGPYTYVSRGIGPRAGFVTGGLLFVTYALLVPAEIGLIGSYLQSTFRAELGVDVPWWLISIVPTVAMLLLTLEGIHASLRTTLVLLTVQVAVVLALALIVVGSGGQDGLTLDPLSPEASPNGLGGITTGFVFAALGFVGFEVATTLGDEVEEPHRVLPRAVLISVLAIGLLYAFCTWAEVNGLGVATTNGLDGTATPWNDLAGTYAPWMTWPVIVASVSSMFAVMVTSANGVARVLNQMGRERLLPAFFAHVDPERHTPSHAILATGAFGVAATVVVGLLGGGLSEPVGGASVYGFLGFLLTLGILVVYVLTNLAAVRYFHLAGRLRVVRHAVLPLVGAGLMLALLVGQVVAQSTAPYTWLPWIIVLWMVLVALGAAWLGRERPADLARAGSVLATGETR